MSDLPGRGVLPSAGAVDRQSDTGTVGDVPSPAPGSHESHPVATEMDRLRATIVTDESRHGMWLALAQYGPLPKRIALGIAVSWRLAKLQSFNGDRPFQARIVPVASDKSSRQLTVVRSETFYVVEVSYPHPTDPNTAATSSPN